MGLNTVLTKELLISCTCVTILIATNGWSFYFKAKTKSPTFVKSFLLHLETSVISGSDKSSCWSPWAKSKLGDW